MRQRKVLALLIAVVLLAGCATLNPVPDDPARTALHKAKLTSLYFLETYKSQLRDANAMGEMAVAGKLTPGQLEVYRTKRILLIKVEPLVLTFDALVAGGTIPAPGREQEINDILNNLLATSSKLGG